MKKIALLGVLLGAISTASAADTAAATITEGDSAAVGQHGFYYAFGLLACQSGERVDFYDRWGRTVELNGSFTRFGGTLALGYQFIPSGKPFCIGLEAGCDMTPRAEEHGSDRIVDGDEYAVSSARNGFRPFVALKLGYMDYTNKFMAYLKAGMSYAEAREHFKDWRGAGNTERNSTLKLNCWMPVIALGLEKPFTKDFTCRGEVEYRFAKSKKKSMTSPVVGGDATLKLTQAGTFNVRVLFCHNIRLGQ